MKRVESKSILADPGIYDWVGAALLVPLLIVAAFREEGIIDNALANSLSLIFILSGVVLAFVGQEKLRRLCELYLWLAFILSLSLLQIAAESLAHWLEVEELVVFQVLAVVHVVIVMATLWVLGAWSQREKAAHSYIARLAAGLLIVGAVVFWVGARTFPGMTLEAISSNPGGHMWTSASFMIATFITLAGLGLFTGCLRKAGDHILSVFGLFSFAFGSVFWIVHLTFRLTVMFQVAEEYAQNASQPQWFQPWNDWAGLLFGIFNVLAYLGIVSFGGALLHTRLLARWVGWTCVIVGFLAAPLFGPPLFIHTVFWVIGILVLRQRKSG